MPWGNRTGPEGMGPMTGRARGYCAGFGLPGYMSNRGTRRSFVRQGFFGYGRGFGRRFNPYSFPFSMQYNFDPYFYQGYMQPNYNVESPIRKEDEILILKEQAEYFKKAMEDVNNRLYELESKEE